MNNETKYIYICGAGFSGSTLLSLVLDGHPQISALGEITHFYSFLENNRLCSCGRRFNDCNFWQAVVVEMNRLGQDWRSRFRSQGLLPQGPSTLAVKRWVQLLAMLGSVRLFSAFRPALGPWRNQLPLMVENDYALFDAARVVGNSQAVLDESKFYLRMKLLYLHRPEGFKTIHLVRDGRAVVFSNRKRGISAERAALNWVKANEATLMMLKSMKKESYLRVKYESFCKKPAVELRRIYDFLGLTPEQQALDFRKFPHHILGGNRMRSGSQGTIGNREEWKSSMAVEDLKRFDRVGGFLNWRLGYR